MRFAPESLHGANAGLNVARDLMEKVKEQFPWISYGDLWTLAGVAAIQEMGGPKIPWRAGRIDGIQDQATPDGRLPDAGLGADHLRNVRASHLTRDLSLNCVFDRFSIVWDSMTKKSSLSPVLTLSVAATATALDSKARGHFRLLL